MNLNSQLSEKLNLDLRFAPTVTENQRVPASAPYFATPPGIVYSAIVHSPTVSPYNPDGTINQLNNQSYLGGGTTTASNPLAIIEAIDDQLFQFQNRGTLSLTYDIIPGLSFKTLGGTYINVYNQDFYRANTLLYRNSADGNPYGQASSSTETNWLWENTLSWTKDFDDHYIDAVIGYTAQKDNLTIKQVLANNYPDDLVPTISGGQVFGGTSLKEQWSLLSSLFRVNYSYKNRYLFTGTFRSDKSSRFGKNNQTGYFPSFSLGWRLSQEDFLADSDLVSELKLRASWGQTGNFEIPNYGAVGLLSPQNYNLGGNEINGLVQATIPNPNLTWEKSEQMDIGLEVGLFDNRVFFMADYYDTTTRDLLLNVAISSVSGFETTLRNLGEVQNKGFELALSTKNFVGDFTWSTDFNFSTNKNEVLALNESDEPMIWLDGLDIPIIQQFTSSFTERLGQKTQIINKPEGDSLARFGSGLLPVNNISLNNKVSPVFSYPYSRTREALEKMKNRDKWDESHGIRLKYTNPLNGGHAIPTMATFMQLLPKSFSGKYSRSTDGTIYCVVEGFGETVIGEEKYNWSKGDVFVVPGWFKFKHNTQEEAVLFSYSDRPVQEMLGLFREEVME